MTSYIAAFWWTLFNLLTIAMLAFYSMMEMAAVSFNTVRLQYYVTKGIKQAVWLNNLLHNPTRLFGTTLIGVNIATVIGSECARETYAALGLSPDLSPLTQVILVVIFGELAPMFAARRFPEHVVMLGSPLLYASARAMEPFLWAISGLSHICQWILGGKKSDANIFLTQEELLHILEEQEDKHVDDEFQEMAANIFKLRHLTAGDIMQPLSKYKILASNATVRDMRELLKKQPVSFCLLYHRNLSNIVSMAYPRDMIRATENKRIRDFAQAPWFITLGTSIMDVMQQFRRNRQDVAVVINDAGAAIGVITLEGLVEEVISFEDLGEEVDPEVMITPKIVINKRLPGSMTVGEFQKQFGVLLHEDQNQTLEELIRHSIGIHPEEGDSIYIEPYQLTISEITLTEIKEISVSTKIK